MGGPAVVADRIWLHRVLVAISLRHKDTEQLMNYFLACMSWLAHELARKGMYVKTLFTLLDLCVSSLRRGHANLLCVVPILTDDLRRGSNSTIAIEILLG